MKKFLLSLFLMIPALLMSGADVRYAGGDISLLPLYEEAGAVYRDYDGKRLAGSALDFFKAEGMNIMRVRLFVAPEKYTGSDKDPNTCQDLDYIIPICRRIKEAGIPLMLDFHYSDTWADPAKQWTPADWASLSDAELYKKIYDYTKETLLTLRNEGILPEFIQTGNEISYGMLWGPVGTSNPKKCYSGSSANWSRFTTLLSNAGDACREVCPSAKIILHTERVANISVQNNFYNKMKQAGVDYDIIGLSYYPYFHGDLSTLDKALTSLESNFPDKEIMIVETGYAYKWAVPGTTFDYSATYPYTTAGQQAFTAALVDTAKQHEAVNGIVWWWPEYNAYSTSLSGWYNAPLFDSTNGRACPAIRALASFATPLASIEGVNADSSAASPVPEALRGWFTLTGVRLADAPTAPGIYIRDGRKIMIK